MFFAIITTKKRLPEISDSPTLFLLGVLILGLHRLENRSLPDVNENFRGKRNDKLALSGSFF